MIHKFTNLNLQIFKMPATRSGRGPKPVSKPKEKKAKTPETCDDIVAQLVSLGQNKKEALALLGTWGKLTAKPKPAKPVKLIGKKDKRHKPTIVDSESESESEESSDSSDSSDSEVEVPLPPPPKKLKKDKKAKHGKSGKSSSPKPQASSSKPPPKFKLDMTYSGATKEDLREFVRLFRLKAKRSQLDEEDRKDELQCVLRGAAIRWWEQNCDSFATTDKLLEGMIQHFTCDTGRRDARRAILKSIKQGEDEQLIEYNARFEAAKVDTYWSGEEELSCYLQGLRPFIFHKVLGAHIDTLQDAMRAAKRVSAQVASLPASAQGLVHPPPPPANTYAPPPSTSQVDAILARLDHMDQTRVPHLAPMQTGPQTRARSNITCGKCGRQGHSADRCGLRCANCKRVGHRTDQCTVPTCQYCKRAGHTSDICFKNPASSSYKGSTVGAQNHGTPAHAPAAPGN